MKTILLIFIAVTLSFSIGCESTKTYDRSVIYKASGSDLAKNYANPSFYMDKIFEVSLRVDHVALGKDYFAVQYHGGFQRSRSGPRVDVILSIEQAKKYNLQEGKVIQFENIVWYHNEQMERTDKSGTFEVMSFKILE